MSANCFRTAVIYRKFDKELLAVQLETGYFFYFASHTNVLFDHFASPQTLASFYEAVGILEDELLERKYLHHFFGFLIENALIIKCTADEPTKVPKVAYQRPTLLRRSHGRIDDELLIAENL